MKRLLFLLILLYSTGCYDSSFSTDDPHREGPLATTSLRTLGEGLQEGERTIITKELKEYHTIITNI